MQGFILDDSPGNFNMDDYNRAQIEQTASSVTDFIISLNILRLLYVKNKDMIKVINERSEEGRVSFSDMYSSKGDSKYENKRLLASNYKFSESRYSSGKRSLSKSQLAKRSRRMRREGDSRLQKREIPAVVFHESKESGDVPSNIDGQSLLSKLSVPAENTLLSKNTQGSPLNPKSLLPTHLTSINSSINFKLDSLNSIQRTSLGLKREGLSPVGTSKQYVGNQRSYSNV